MVHTFILHSWKTNEEIYVGWNNFRSEGTTEQPGTRWFGGLMKQALTIRKW